MAAFYNCMSLGEVSIPTSVTAISDRTFDYCSSLSTVTVPESVTNIGLYAFADCTSLTNVTIPNSVISIENAAFGQCTSLTSVTIGNGVTSIGSWAFKGCTNLISVYFKGNTPSISGSGTLFDGYDNATVYYLPGTIGWGPMFSGRPTALWWLPNPLILNNGDSFGVQTNGFGFIISWATNVSVAVEACTNLANSVWTSVGTNTLTSGSSYFSDPEWTNYPARFCRLRSP